MKTASTLMQLIALTTCFVAHQAFHDDLQMTGVRRAVETTAGKHKTGTAAAGASIILAP